MGGALLERAPRQHGLYPCQAPPLAFALQPVPDDGPARQRPHACPHKHARGQVPVARQPAPVVVEAGEDVRERLPPRRPPPPLREDGSPSIGDLSDPTPQPGCQLRLPLGSSRLQRPCSAACASSLPACSRAPGRRAWSAGAPAALLVSTSRPSMGIRLTWETIATPGRGSQGSPMEGGSLAPTTPRLIPLGV
jgi:hypothetical protein